MSRYSWYLQLIHSFFGDNICWSSACLDQDRCSFLQGLLLCGLQCKPDMNQYFDPRNGLLNVCANFYDDMVESCKNVKRCPDSDIDCHSSGPSPSPNCENVYSSPSDVWAIRFGPISVQTANRVEGTNCFAGGTTVFPSLLLLVAVAAVSLLLLLSM